ncbi:helix-turn-helix domain-containing protein [Pseudonocardia sp. DR1-2]|uniref:AraC family transcriptional regulator n=1 Tax=Pseudonocardia sp. DR1-2 TaxID=2951168 RepID=UPI00255A9C0C
MGRTPERPEPSVDGSETCGPLAHGERVPAHSHEFGQLRYAVSGVLVTSTAAGVWMAPTDRISWVPPFHAHWSRSYGETHVRFVTVPAPHAAQLPAHPSVFVASALMREAFLALVDDQEPADGARGRLLLQVVVAELARAPEEPLRLPEPRDPRLRDVISLLHDDPASGASLAELGRTTGSSERTLSRLFRAELSMGFQQWRTLLRVQRAVVELSGGASVTDTAVGLGWANPSSFIEAFTRLVGETPGRYRARRHSGHG